MADSDSLAALYAQARIRGALFDLSDRAKWRLSGADRIRFLNGQATNDIRRVRPDAALTACITTAKGRLSGLIYVSAAPDFLRIDSEPELRESLAARLERYIIADDVAIEDVTGQECLFHLLAPTAPSGLRQWRAATRFASPGWDLIAPRAEHAALLAALSAIALLIPAPLIETFRIEAGIPRWGAELTEDTLPPEAGLDDSAIDYHKGCYIGQEVISRIKSLGHVNRTLAGFTAAAPLTPGMTLHPEADPAKNAGEITSAAWSFGLECWAALGYLKRGFHDAPLLARSPDGSSTPVQTRPLPLFPPLEPTL
jgi:folate-binding protein YgfZ